MWNKEEKSVKLFTRIRQVAKIDSFVFSVRPHGTNNSAPSGSIFMKLDLKIFRKYVEKIQVLSYFDKNNGYLIRMPKYIYDISLNTS